MEKDTFTSGILQSDTGRGPTPKKPPCNEGDRISPPTASLHWHPRQSYRHKGQGTKDAEEKGVQDDRADRETGEWISARGVGLRMVCVKA